AGAGKQRLDAVPAGMGAAHDGIAGVQGPAPAWVGHGRCAHCSNSCCKLSIASRCAAFQATTSPPTRP
ncbi:hypothetical protein, partial [Xanthomonas arboricola]|uniref:hypothetical protein n=1 Tax=Xanthomonas arboricola TaxID=56448 RepID=UPI0011B0C0B5